jgi:hypothetical protein
MPVRFDSLKVTALVDSGSSINIMSDQLYYSLPHKCKSALNFEAKDSIKLANDQTVQVEGTYNFSVHFETNITSIYFGYFILDPD